MNWTYIDVTFFLITVTFDLRMNLVWVRFDFRHGTTLRVADRTSGGGGDMFVLFGLRGHKGHTIRVAIFVEQY